MKRFLLLLISFTVFLITPLLDAAKATEQSGHRITPQEILILNSYHPGYAFSDDEQTGVIDVFQAKDKNWVPVIEYLDMKRLPDGKHLIELKKLFRQKYQNRKFSVVIAMDNPALEFAIDNQAELFRNAPIVFCGINNYTSSLLKGRTNVTGIMEAIDPAGTIEVMLRLHPATQEIFIPHDYTVSGLSVPKDLEALVPRFGPKVRFRFTDPLTMEELLKELERLPKDSLVLAITFITDKSGRTFGISETTKLFAEHSPVPIYSTHEQRLGFGIVGGKLLSGRIQGTDAAHIALRILAGEKASAIPVDSESDSQFMFDYKVMRRFGIPLSALPENSIVINKPASFYAAHRAVIQAALGVIGILIMVVSMLTVIIIQRRRSLELIRRSEELFKVITSSTPDHLLVQESDLRYSFVMNPQLGLTEQDMIGKTDHGFLSKEDADKLTEIKRQVLNTGRPVHLEVPLTSSTGEQQFFNGSYVPKFDAKGQIDGLIGYFRNVTEQKKAEEALQESEVKLRTIFESSVDAIGVSKDGIQTFMNPAYLSLFGYSSVDELINQPVLKLVAPSEHEIILEHIRSHAKGEIVPWQYETRGRRKDGTEFDMDVRVSVYELGGETYSLVILRDITFRKQAEGQIKASLREKEALLKEIQHRVKNNLVTISGILAFQSERIKDSESKDAFITSMNRINTMTKIHTRLYQSDNYSLINFKGYMEELVRELSHSYGFPRENIITDIRDISLDINTAIPAGLIVNELVSNAMKHAFPFTGAGSGERGR